jgi:uncharacterized protein (TIGR02271 family)
VALKDADFEVADGYPDPTGWEVRAGDANGPKVGKVDDLLVDPDARRVRYLMVKLDKDVARGGEREVLIPVGAARLNDDRDTVLVPNRDRDFFAGLPAYEPGRFSRDYENDLRERFSGAPMPASDAGRDYYGHEQYDESQLFRGSDREARIPRSEEELAVGRRRVQAGEVDVRKSVETEHVARDVPVTREEVEVERRPVAEGTPGQADLEEGEIRVPVMAEEAVVEKRPVVKEEFIIRKRVVSGTQRVEADVRRERVDVDRQQGADAQREAARERDRRTGDEPRAP